jgi:hypothetical protein
MNIGRTVFVQLMDHVPAYEFHKCVTRYRGDDHLRSFSCWDQFLAMAFAQLTYRESLRDIEACLRSMTSNIGLRGKVARSTLADANESHDWRIYADFAQVLIGIARSLYAHDPIGVDLDQSLYALDSTTIDLCLSLFSWARFRQHKAAVKLHTLLDLHGNIPTFLQVTAGAAFRFAHFLENAFVRRVSLRSCIRMVKFCRSICEVQIRSGSGLPLTGSGTAPTTSGAEYRAWPSREAA